MTHTNLSILDTETLLRHAYAQMDDLTTSDMERELLRRLEARETEEAQALDDTEFSAADIRRLGEVFEGYTTEEVTELLGVMLEVNIGTKRLIEILRLLEKEELSEPDELKTALELAQKFQQVANDLADALPRLTTLVTETAL